VSAGLHWLRGYRLAGALTVGHVIDLALAVGRHRRRQAPSRMLPIVPGTVARHELVDDERLESVARSPTPRDRRPACRA
jgi:hypothetical protein